MVVVTNQQKRVTREEANENQFLLRDLTRLLDHDLGLFQGRHLGRSRDHHRGHSHDQIQDQGKERDEALVLDSS